MPTRVQEIEAELAAMLAAHLGSERPVGPATDLITDLRLESVQIMEFVVEIEDRYDIAIDLDTLSEARTVGDLAAIVARHLGS